MKHCLLVAVSLASASLAQAGDLEAGTATCDITPPTGYPMCGYSSRRDLPGQGTLDRLRPAKPR